MNIIENIEKEQMEKLTAGKNMPNFKPGDTLKVHTKVKEGDRERIQVYEGVCIARKNDGLNSSFTVRKISFGEGVERVFPLYSPNVAKIEVARIGKVRRAKLYYLRKLCVAVLLVLQTIWLLLQRLVKKLPLLNKRKQKVMEKPPFGAVFLC